MILCGNIFSTPSLSNPKSKGAEILRRFASPNLSYVKCHMSCVTYHLSCVTCVMCHMYKKTKKKQYVFFLVEQSVGASRWRVCYQWGLPRLVCYITEYSMALASHLLKTLQIYVSLLPYIPKRKRRRKNLYIRFFKPFTNLQDK